jgi:hypothetical protein
MELKIGFDEEGDAVVVKQFVFAGRTFKPGEEFPWRTSGVNAGKVVPLTRSELYGLWAAELVRFKSRLVAQPAPDPSTKRARAPQAT